MACEEWNNVTKSLTRTIAIVKQCSCLRNVKAAVSEYRDESSKQREDHSNSLFDRV